MEEICNKSSFPFCKLSIGWKKFRIDQLCRFITLPTPSRNAVQILPEDKLLMKDEEAIRLFR